MNDLGELYTNPPLAGAGLRSYCKERAKECIEAAERHERAAIELRQFAAKYLSDAGVK